MSYNAPGNVQYNYAQLEGIWCMAGGSATAAPIAAAIAMAESGGNTTATGQNPGSVDRGLWQINSSHGSQSTYDVMGNARAAVAISNNGTNWRPWTTYNNGAYRQYVQTGVTPDTSAPINGTNAAANATLTGAYGIPGVPTSVPDFLDPTHLFRNIFNLPQSAANQVDKSIASALQQVIVQIFQPTIQMIAGVAGIAAGGTMLLVGIFLVVRSTDTGQEVGRAAGGAAQLGVSAFAPETKAVTEYTSSTGAVSTVTQRRRPGGSFKIGGRPIQYRPTRIRTTVDRPKTPKEALRDEANGYNKFARNDPENPARYGIK